MERHTCLSATSPFMRPHSTTTVILHPLWARSAWWTIFLITILPQLPAWPLHENLHFTDPEAMRRWLCHLPRRLQEGSCFPKSLMPEKSSLGYDAIWGELVVTLPVCGLVSGLVEQVSLFPTEGECVRFAHTSMGCQLKQSALATSTRFGLL